MDEQTNQALFTKIGELDAKATASIEHAKKLEGKFDKLEERLRKQELKQVGLSAFVAAAVSALFKTFTGGGGGA